MAESVYERDRQIRNSVLTMAQTFYLCTLNQFVGNNPDAWPSQATIAEAMNATSRAVRNWQSELEQLGIIEVDLGCGRSSTNRYRLRLDRLTPKGGTAFRISDQKEEPRSAFNPVKEEPRSAFSSANEEPRSYLRRNNIPLNEEPRSYRKNSKEQLKEQRECAPSENVTERVNTTPETESKPKRFQKPTVEQIRSYATSERNAPHFDAEKFFDYYESNGWRVGRNPMKDWQAAVRKWLRDEKPAGPQTQGSNPAVSDVWRKALEVIRKIDVLQAGYPETLRQKLGDRPARTLMKIGVRRIQDANDFQRREMAVEFSKEMETCR